MGRASNINEKGKLRGEYTSGQAGGAGRRSD